MKHNDARHITPIAANFSLGLGAAASSEVTVMIADAVETKSADDRLAPDQSRSTNIQFLCRLLATNCPDRGSQPRPVLGSKQTKLGANRTSILMSGFYGFMAGVVPKPVVIPASRDGES